MEYDELIISEEKLKKEAFIVLDKIYDKINDLYFSNENYTKENYIKFKKIMEILEK